MALGMARAEAVQKAFGLQVKDQFVEITTQRANGGSDLAIRELRAVAQGLVVGEDNVRWKSELINTGPNQAAITRHTVVGDFIVTKPPTSRGAFSVTLKLSKATVISGESIRLDLSGTETAYATVFNLAADNRVYVLVPNRFRPEVKLGKGENVQIPAAGDAFELRPYTVPGHREDAEVFRVVATKTPVSAPVLDQDGSVSLLDFMTWLSRLPPDQWAEAQQVFTVVSPRPSGGN